MMFSGLFAAGEAGAVFLLISPSATSNGLGSSGVSLRSNDIYSTFFNPAHSILSDGFSFQSSDISTNWLQSLANDIYLQSDVKRISYSGNKILKNDKFDLQLSISQLNLDLNLGEQVSTDSQGNMLGYYNAYMESEWTTFSFGIKSKKQPFYFSVGLTNKKSIQNFGQSLIEGQEIPISKDDFYDLGFKFLIDDYSYKDVLGLTYSLGYSKSNIGDFISFTNTQLADPAPRVARLGMSLGIKFKPFLDKDLVLGVTHVNEAEDLLIKTIQGESPRYDNSLLGDINIGDHIFSDKTDSGVIIHRGKELNFFNIYFTRTGKYIDAEGDINIRTKGTGINYSKSSSFMLSIINKIIKIEDDFLTSMNRILNIIDIQKNYSKYYTDNGHPLENTDFEETTISLNYKF